MKITVVLKGGEEKIVEGREGATLLEILEENDLPIFGGCGGMGVCGSCRVRIDPACAGQLPAPEDQERDTLEMFSADDGTRLACQVMLTGACEGLRVILI